MWIGVGRLGRDPEGKYLPSGDPVCNFSIACDSGFGEKKKTFWADIVCFGKTASACQEFLGKGALVLVQGRVQKREWETDGAKRSRVEIVADTVRFLDKRGASSGSTSGGDDFAPPEETAQEPF